MVPTGPGRNLHDRFLAGVHLNGCLVGGGGMFVSGQVAGAVAGKPMLAKLQCQGGEMAWKSGGLSGILSQESASAFEQWGRRGWARRVHLYAAAHSLWCLLLNGKK